MKVLAFPTMQSFDLKTDPEGLAKITVRQASQGENILRQDAGSTRRQVWGDDTERMSIEFDYNGLELQRKEAYLTLALVSGIEDEMGNVLFRSAETSRGPRVSAAMTEDEFNAAYNKLPADVCEEIAGYVHEVNASWGPKKPKAE